MSTTVLTRTYFALAYIFSALLTAVMAVFAYDNGGEIEGRLFPVIQDARITRVEASGPFHSLVWGDFRKVRDCKLVGMDWRRDGSFVPFRFIEAVEPALDGEVFEFGPIEIALPADMVADSRSFVTHRCHPMWETRSEFLSPDGR